MTDLFGCRSGSTYAIVYLLRTHNVLLFSSHTMVCLRLVLFLLPCNSAHIAPLKYHEQICVSLKGSCNVKIVSAWTHLLSGLLVASHRTRSETGQLGQNVFVQTLKMCFRRIFGAASFDVGALIKRSVITTLLSECHLRPVTTQSDERRPENTSKIRSKRGCHSGYCQFAILSALIGLEGCYGLSDWLKMPPLQNMTI